MPDFVVFIFRVDRKMKIPQLHSFIMISRNFLTPCCTKNAFSICLYATLRERAKKTRPVELYEPVFENPRLYPDYELLSVRLQSYDFVPLERYQSYVHKIAKRFNFIVDKR